MNDLYIYQLETENKQLRTELHIERAKIQQAIEYIKEHSEMTDLQICGIENVLAFRGSLKELLEILGEKE